MLAKESTYLDSTWEQLQVISQDKQKRMEYTARLKAQLDHNQTIWEAEERGIEKGVKQNQRTVIQTMLKSLPIEQIAALLELSVEEAQSILQNDQSCL